MSFGWNLMMWGCMAWLPALMYFLMKNEAKPKKNIIVGVTLPYEAHADPEVLAILERFKKEMKLLCVLVLLPVIPGCFIRGFGLSLTVWLIWIVSMCVVFIIPYARCNTALKRLKEARGWRRSVQPAATERKTAAMELKWLSPLLFLPPLLVSLAPIPFDRELWPMWATDAGLIVLFYLCYRWLYRNKAEVVDSDTGRTEALTKMRRYYWGKCWLILSWATGLFNIGLWLTMDHIWWQMAVILLYGVGTCVVAIGVEFRVRGMQEKLTADCGACVDEDDRWIWGMFYYNPDDKKLIVNNRVGMNTTMNLARRPGQIILGLGAAVLLACPLVGVWLMGMEKAPVELCVTTEAVVASHYNSEWTVALDDIQEVEVLEELPGLRRVAGTGLPSALTGKFTSEYGERFTCCLDPRTGPWLLIMEEGGGRYLFGSSEPGAAEKVLAQITQ